MEEKQIIPTEETQMVRFQGQKHLLTESIIQNLPEIVKREILFPKLNDKEFGMQERQVTVKRIISMFQMKFPDKESLQIAMAEFGGFLSGYYLTSPEVLEAYRMVAKLELCDFKGDKIEFFPNLSIGQAGKILQGYMDYKRRNSLHTKGHEAIKAYLNPPTEVSLEEKKAIRKSNWDKMLASAKEGGECDHAFIFYDFFAKKELFNDFINNKELQSELIQKEMKDIYNIEKKKIGSALFTKNDLEIISKFIYDNIHSKDLCIDKLKNMAIVKVKNKLVYDHVKTQVK